MTVTVTVPSSMSSDGTIHIYTDDSSPTTGLDGGGHVERLLPLILDNVSIANVAVNSAISAQNDAASANASALLAEIAADNVNTLGSATGLQTTGSPVVTTAAAPPTAGQVLTATSSTTAAWQNATVKKLIEKSVKSLVSVGTVTTLVSSVWLDADRVLITLIGSSTEMYAVVYNRTSNVFGTPVLVRAVNYVISATKVATDLA